MTIQDFETVIGLEVHVQLLTKSKLFCACSTTFGAEPNSHTCPVCLGWPGSLPVLNREALRLGVRTGLALNCHVAERLKFDRKNYFYPDLPKAYQISQYDMPVNKGGSLTFELRMPDGSLKEHTVGITRAHLEEDAGKLLHEGVREGSLADYNRAGTPLLEIVSEPDIRSPEEAYAYLTQLKAILEAVVYITDEPLSAQQLAAALERPIDVVQRLLNELVEEYAKPEHGLAIREVAGGYKMATKAEHHEAIRAFVKKLTPPLKLSLPALETLAVIAYKQPVTTPEIMEIRGVQGASVLKTLLDRKLITEAGRKKVVGQPILYKTTKEFLVQFGLKDLSELPTLKEFEELGRLSVAEPEGEAPQTELLLEAEAPPDATGQNA